MTSSWLSAQRGTCGGPEALLHGGAGTQPLHSPDGGRRGISDVCADGRKWGCGQMSRRWPQCPCVFSRAVLFTTAFIPFVLLYLTADHGCTEGGEVSAQTQWLMLLLVTAGRFLHQRGRSVSS